MKSAIITGASSGIGKALAGAFAKRGYRVSLLARRLEALREIESSLKEDGFDCLVFACDVTNVARTRECVTKTLEEWGSVDVAVANAGIGFPTFARKFKFEDASAIMRTNVEGTMTLFDAVIPSMIENRKGRFAGVASIAGFRGLPGASTYSASKAAMQAFLEASRVELMGTGVGVTIVNPGFIETPLTEKNRFPMPFLLQPREAAERIADGIEAGRREVNFPLPMVMMTKVLRYLPNVLFDRVSGHYGKRKRDESKYRK